MSKLQQTGFTVVEGVLILIVICLLGFSGWYVWHTRSAITSPQKTEATRQPAANITWKSLTLKNEKLRLQYPSSWRVKDFTSDQYSDNVAFTGSNGFTVHIMSGVGVNDFTLPLGGFHLAKAVPVTFIGHEGWLVMYNGAADGEVLDTELSAAMDSVTFFAAKNMPVPAGDTSRARIAVQADYGDNQPRSVDNIQNSQDFQYLIKLVDSMSY